VRVLPTLVVFNDGISTSRIVGFEGLVDEMVVGREDEWRTCHVFVDFVNFSLFSFSCCHLFVFL